MDNSPFQRLSAELRNRIYGETFANSKGIVIDCRHNKIYSPRETKVYWSNIDVSDPDESGIDDSDAYEGWASVSSPSIALTQTCREVREESLKMYYSMKSITILGSAPHHGTFPSRRIQSNLEAYQDDVGADQLQEVRRINFKFRGPAWNYADVSTGLDMNRERVRNARGLFHPSACFKVQLEMQVTDKAGDVQKGVWDVDQPIEKLKETRSKYNKGTNLVFGIPARRYSVSEALKRLCEHGHVYIEFGY